MKYTSVVSVGLPREFVMIDKHDAVSYSKCSCIRSFKNNVNISNVLKRVLANRKLPYFYFIILCVLICKINLLAHENDVYEFWGISVWRCINFVDVLASRQFYYVLYIIYIIYLYIILLRLFRFLVIKNGNCINTFKIIWKIGVVVENRIKEKDSYSYKYILVEQNFMTNCTLCYNKCFPKEWKKKHIERSRQHGLVRLPRRHRL